MTISWADCEPCGREFKDKKRIQSGPPWKQLSLPRLVFFFFFLNRWLSILNFCTGAKKAWRVRLFFSHHWQKLHIRWRGCVKLHSQAFSVSMLRTQTRTCRQGAEAGPCCFIGCLNKKNIRGKKFRTNAPRTVRLFYNNELYYMLHSCVRLCVVACVWVNL